MTGRILGFILLLISTQVYLGQCLTAPFIDSLDQPTCSNQYGVIYLSGLPSTGWTINSIPSGFTQSGVGAIAAISGLTPGTAFSFQYLNTVAGCTSPATSSVNINLVPSVPATPIAGMVTQPTCIVATGAVAISNLPSTGGWTITAHGNAPATTFTQNGIGVTASFTGLPVNSYSFSVTNLNNGCVSANSNTVFVNNPIPPAAPVIDSVDNPTCFSAQGIAFLSGLPMSGTWTLIINPGGTSQTGTGTTTSVVGLNPATNYTFIVVNAASCSSAVSNVAAINAALSIPTVPVATLTQPSCPLPTGMLTVTSPIGPGYTYSLNSGTPQASTSFMSLAGGNYTLSVTSLSSGCTTTNPTTYVLNPTPQPPAISISFVNNVTCFGASNGSAAVQVDSLGTPPFVFSWSPVAVSNDTVTGLSPGSYNIVVVDAANCVVVQGITITEPSALTIIADSTPVNCATGVLGTMDVTVNGGTGPYAYLWQPINEITDSISGLNIGNYSVTVSDANGCQISASGTIGIVNALPITVIPADTVINPSTSFIANAYGGTVYSWTPSDGLSCDNCVNPSVAPDSSVVYYLQVSDNNGCQGEDSMVVTVKLLCGEFFVPTIFSPNGTGPSENNTLKVFGKSVCVKDFGFVIYDRWGQKVYESTNINKEWDGFYKGRPAQEGNYVFDLNIQLYDDTILHKSGSLTLVR
ncbi:MAG: gliding motility-associated C-terminal domain-containing protein [Flavobacteriales bacterium]